MKITEEMKKAISNYIEENDLDLEYAYIGLRVQYEPFELGEISHVSHIWEDNEDTGEELSGICATKIERIGRIEYCGEHAALLVSDNAEYGEDDGELIMEDAKVVMILA